MKNKLGISVVVTCYNLEKYIEEALRSVFEQDYDGPMEIIIVDDASQDNSVILIEETIRKYGEKFDVSFIRNERNMGVSGATDRGWQQAKYDWIVEVDGDDIQYLNRCSNTAWLANRYPNAGMIVMSHRCINDEGRGDFARYFVMGNDTDASFCAETPRERADIFLNRAENFPVRRGAYGCSMAINKKVVDLWGPLNAESIVCYAQDPPWELRAFLSYPIVWSNMFACKYRSHSTNILNRIRKNSSVEDIIENELSMCQYDKKEILALVRMLADINKGSVNVCYSDWRKEDLESCRTLLNQYLVARKIRANWWNLSFFKKLYLIVQYCKQLPVGFSSCLITRLLPLKVFAWIKMLKRL